MIDQMSPAEQEVLARASTSEALECQTCGRDCKHVPQLPGGGTAGGDKGTRWAETDRSKARCPSCGQKPHRKEGRPHQEIMCLMAQAAQRTGLTTFPRPTAEILRIAADLVDTGEYREPPTEKQMSAIIAGIPVEDAMKPTEKRVAQPKVSRRVPKMTPGEELENVVPGGPIEMPEIPEMLVAPAIKTKAEKEAERAAAQAVKDADKAAAKAQRELDRENIRKIRDDAREAEKARKATERNETKTEKEARLLARAESGAYIEPGEAPGEDDGYDPLAGVGEDFEDDEDELTPEQLAAVR